MAEKKERISRENREKKERNWRKEDGKIRSKLISRMPSEIKGLKRAL